MKYLDELNDSQRDAVLYNDGPELVIAGAGSGKTRVLTYKVAYLLESGVKASSILALTFTNKAAREMKERISAIVPASDARYLWMGTFHSICAKILRAECQKLGYTRDFSIYDTSDSKSVIRSIVKEKGLDEKIYKQNDVLERISRAKNQLLTPEAYAMDRNIEKRDRFDRLYDMADIYKLYDVRIKASNAMDFDDLLMRVCLLFRHNPEVLKYYQEIFQYVLVDEYQDTNYCQYLIVKMLAAPQNRICVVGDDAQSIYSFRGADIRNILSFGNGYNNARLFKLERNYRSTQTIVKAANSLIHKNESQIFKEVYSEKCEGDRLELVPYMTDRDEAMGVAKSVYLNRRSTPGGYADIAILYRTNAQSRAFENEFRRLGIPYRIYGGTSFYQRKEIKDAIAYFRLVVNSYDNEALRRVINFPKRGIGDSTVNKIMEHASQYKCSMMDVISKPSEMGLPVSEPTKKKLLEFAAMITRFTEMIDTMGAYEFADAVLHQTGILAEAAADRTQEGIERKENLDELLSGIHDFVDQREQEGVSFTPVQDFLAEISLLTDQDEHLEDHTPRITLMTVHAAKGLEFPIIYVVGLEENLFPSQFCTSSADIEEERRLLYVALTRAMEKCTLTYTRQRFKNGCITLASPSRFLKDIDHKFIRETDSNVNIPSSRFSAFPTFAAKTTGKQEIGRIFKPVNKTFPSVSSDKSASINSRFVPGDRVYHRVFGEGNVLYVYNENDNDKIDIQFDKVGKKTLLLTYAKLEKR